MSKELHYKLVQQSMAEGGDPGAKYEIVPHVIPVDILINETGITNYQAIIKTDDVAAQGFLLERINTRHNTQSLRIRKADKVYYSAPGWLHYVHHDVMLQPALFMTDFGWYIDVSFSWYLQTDVKELQIALIGQRVIKLT